MASKCPRAMRFFEAITKPKRIGNQEKRASSPPLNPPKTLQQRKNSIKL
jgi:hypothetical protein